MIIASNFKYSSRKFLDDRQQCPSLTELEMNLNNYLYPLGFEVYCVYEKKWYQNVAETENDTPVWEERKGGVGGGNADINIDDLFEDGEISAEKTWSSEYINSFKINLEQLITNNEDYIAEIEDRVLYIEGTLHWLEFDGTYDSLEGKPFIPTKVSELENDSNYITDNEVNARLESFITNDVFNNTLSNYPTTVEVDEKITEIEGNMDGKLVELEESIQESINSVHNHENKEVLDTITNEKILQWDSMVENSFSGDYNYLDNKPIEYLGDDSEIKINLNNVSNGTYIINNTVDKYILVNELSFIEKIDEQIIITLPRMSKVLTFEMVDGAWAKVKEENYQVDKDNANITNSLNIGENNIVAENNQIVQGKFNEEDTEGKYINIVGNGENEDNRKNIHTLDWEGNAWYNGKVSQEGVPTEDKDLVTKGYVDGKFATSERVEQYIEKNDKENARRDVIIDALANGRKRTTEIVDGEADLLFATEKDTVFIDKIEGETLVNVCDQEEPIAITKSYTVENTNHIALQGEYDGKCRPVVNGNTLVNRNVEYDESRVIGTRINESGVEINLEGTFNSEIEVSLDGHTATNLGTEKGGELCKSFDNAVGNEIELVANIGSKTDVVCEGDTLVNLLSRINWGGITDETSTSYINIEYTIISNCTITIINYNDKDIRISTNYIESNTWANFCKIDANSYVTFTIPSDQQLMTIYGLLADGWTTNNKIDLLNKVNIFEGDLTQTPHLIPTEYVEGIKSTFEDKLIPYSVMTDEYESVSETQYRCDITIKPNTTYTIVSSFNLDKYQYAVYTQDELTSYVDYSETIATRTFSSDVGTIRIKTRLYPLYEGEDYSFTLSEVVGKMLIVEGDWTGRENLLVNEYFGKYKVDMQSVGKNLFDKNNINRLDYMWQGSKIGINDDIGVISTDNYETIYWIKIKPSTSYTIRRLGTFRNRIGFSKVEPKLGVQTRALTNIGSVEELGVKLNENYTITVSSLDDEKYLLISGYCLYDKVNKVYRDICTEQELLDSIQIEEGTQATSYEPYHGTTKTFYLNSPLYKEDRIEMHNGKLCHYHKMGSVVLNGSEDWIYSSISSYGDYKLFYLTNPSKLNLKPSAFDDDEITTYSDRFSGEIRKNILNENSYGIYGKECIFNECIMIHMSKLSTTDVNGFKQWLQQNPTTVVYELANPWYEPIGEYGKLVFDGSDDEGWIQHEDVSSVFVVDLKSVKPVGANEYGFCMCDKLKTVNGTIGASTVTHACKIQQYFNEYTKLQVKITTDINTLDELKQWLQANPITIIYELENPQLIDEDMTFNIATSSTLSYESNVPMGTSTFLPYVDELNLLESSTQYSVSFNCDVVGLPLVVSLGGTTTNVISELYNTMSIITPPIETDGKLMIDGFGIANIDNVVIVKGDKAYKYFEGIKSSFEDKHIKNILNNDTVIISNLNSNTGKPMAASNIVSTDYINISNQGITVICEDTEYVFHKAMFYDNNENFISRDKSNNLDRSIRYVVPKELSNEIAKCRVCFQNGLNDSTKDINLEEFKIAKIVILKGDWTSNPPTYEEVINNENKYQAKIKLIKSPLEFGKGGRL